LRVVSLLSDAAAPGVRAVAARLEAALERPVTLVESVPWQAREQLLDEGQASLAFMCGLLFMRKRATGAALRAVVAPVPAAPRYGGLPIYFSDVVVRADSSFTSFAELRRHSWAYNEPGSYSGYAAVRWHLAQLGERDGYFSRAVETGSHLASLGAVLDGVVDATAIDSTALDDAVRADPALTPRFRTIGYIGPSPIPPVVGAEFLGPALLERIGAALTSLHLDPPGLVALAAGGVARYVSCATADYQVLVERAALGRDVPFSPVAKSP
jgi:phosphonate transport system substrate-binding protein